MVWLGFERYLLVDASSMIIKVGTIRIFVLASNFTKDWSSLQDEWQPSDVAHMLIHAIVKSLLGEEILLVATVVAVVFSSGVEWE